MIVEVIISSRHNDDSSRRSSLQLRFIWYPTVSEDGTRPFYGEDLARIETYAR